MKKDNNASFSENPIIYHLITDRFHSAGTRGDGSYGRRQDGGSVGSFHGGNFAGISKKLCDGWFCDLGVNAIWISAPYEQIHGWVPSSSGFRYEAYHGYWPLDFTCVDANFGDRETFAEMVALARSKGISVIIDIVMSHVGYPDVMTIREFLPSAIKNGYEDANIENYQDSFVADSKAMLDWWGPEWVRAEIPGYEQSGETELTKIMFGLPKLLTERHQFVSLPKFLLSKTDTRAVNLPSTTVAGYLINWLCQWIRDFGVSGFRCDSARHVDLSTWSALKSSAMVAYQEWHQNSEYDVLANNGFWMLGEVFGHGVGRSDYFDNGFDSVINFAFQHELKEILLSVDVNSIYGRQLAWMRLDRIYSRYAQELGERRYDVLSYLSSHDTELFPRELLHFGATALMLLPGGVQIFYGDETARLPHPTESEDPVQATRSDMNWNEIDTVLHSHWKAIGKFRRKHPALSRGKHMRLESEPYIFVREDEKTADTVVVALGNGHVLLDISQYFGLEGKVNDFYNGKSYEISNGCIELLIEEIALLEKT